jgi:hypothetical protein
MLWLLARVQLEFETTGETSLQGVVIPALFLAALVAIVFANRLRQETPLRKNKAPSLSSLLIELPPVADPSSGSLRETGARGTAALAGLTGRERRVAVRRGGNPMPIVLADPSEAAVSLEGTVLDRSRGGLLIASPELRPTGSMLRVRPKDAPEDVDWVGIQVRHARQKNGRWLLGCAFTRKMDWSELLIFG